MATTKINLSLSDGACGDSLLYGIETLERSVEMACVVCGMPTILVSLWDDGLY